jgi:hypothetical protein
MVYSEIIMMIELDEDLNDVFIIQVYIIYIYLFYLNLNL